MTELVLIGEAWGKDEDEFKHPFVGASGQELWRMLGDAGFPCSPLPYQFVSPWRMMNQLWPTLPHQLLNVFNERPADNQIDLFFAHLSDEVPVDRKLPCRRSGSSNLWVRKEFAHHVYKLHEDLERLKPNLIIALGATACWALNLPTGIGKSRGTVTESKWGKVLPVYHPSAILRGWSNRVTTVLDLHKALRQKDFPEIRTLERHIWYKPTISDLYEWWDTFGKHAPLLGVDIETLRNEQISEITFSASSTQALHVPFVIQDKSDKITPFQSWWPDLETELKAWDFVRMACSSPIPKIGQNVVQYDTYWLLHEMGIPLTNIQEDTMTLAHCWQPELDKNLGFLASIFCDEKAWKHIRTDTVKEND